jgi:hypothetical protein
VRYQDETGDVVHVFASRLEYSRWAAITRDEGRGPRMVADLT